MGWVIWCNGGLIVWDLESKIEKRISLANKVSDFTCLFNTFSSDGQTLALFEQFQEFIELVNIVTQEVVCVLEHSRRTKKAVFSPDRSLLAGLSYGTISFWNTSSGSKDFSLTCECESEGESGSYSAMAFCPHTRIFAAGCCNKSELWDLDSKKSLFIAPCAIAYTDFWAAYGTVLPSKRHRAVGKETGMHELRRTIQQHAEATSVSFSAKNLVLFQVSGESYRCYLVFHPLLQCIITCLALPIFHYCQLC